MIKKLLLAFAVLPFALMGCGTSSTPPESAASTTTGTTPPAQPASVKDQVVGTWKVDMAKSSLEGMTDKEKAEGETVRLDIKADGTYVGNGPSGEVPGTWKVEDRKITFTSQKQGDTPPNLTLSEDGSQLTFSMTEGGKTASIVMVKA